MFPSHEHLAPNYFPLIAQVYTQQNSAHSPHIHRRANIPVLVTRYFMQCWVMQESINVLRNKKTQELQKISMSINNKSIEMTAHLADKYWQVNGQLTLSRKWPRVTRWQQACIWKTWDFVYSQDFRIWVGQLGNVSLCDMTMLNIILSQPMAADMSCHVPPKSKCFQFQSISKLQLDKKKTARANTLVC